MAGTNCQVKRRFEPCLFALFHNNPATSLCPTLPHFITSAVLVVGRSFSLLLYQKLREFRWLSGSLLEAVGWICPSMEVFLSLALNKKRSQWSMSCSPLVLPTEAWRLPLQMGLEGTHTNWITEAPLELHKYHPSSLSSCYTEHYSTTKKWCFKYLLLSQEDHRCSLEMGFAYEQT